MIDKIPAFTHPRFAKKSFNGGIDSGDAPSLTVQSETQGCDINYILRQYAKTGVLPDIIKENPQYGDFSDAPDYRAACDIKIFADEQFAALDAPLRRRFNNDPAEFLEFCGNKNNVDEMERLGLLKPEVVAKRVASRDAKPSGEPAPAQPPKS